MNSESPARASAPRRASAKTTASKPEESERPRIASRVGSVIYDDYHIETGNWRGSRKCPKILEHPAQRRVLMPVIKAFDLAYGRLRAPDLAKEEEFLTDFGMIRAD